MKWSSICYATGVVLLCVIGGCTVPEDSRDPRGPYLGQNPPGLEAEPFAPGIVTTDSDEVMYAFADDATLLLFERTPPDFDRDWIHAPLYRTEMVDGVWVEPRLLETTGRPWYFEYDSAPEGTEVVFAWRKNLDGSGPERDIDLWRVVRGSNDWQEPEPFPPPVKTEAFDSWPSLSANGTLYFFSTREGGFGRSDLYQAATNDSGEFDVENLGEAVNSGVSDHDPFIAPDESYLLFCSNRSGVLGENDLFVSFRLPDGGWTNPANLGEGVNTAADDTRPYVTPDGRYLFFNSTANGSRSVFWVSAEVIENVRPD